MATDQVSFFDEPLKKQIEGYFVSDGREIHVSVAYGALGPVIDYNSQVLLVRKLLNELAGDPSKELRKPHPALGSRNGNKKVTLTLRDKRTAAAKLLVK
jgi:hypothetical protein